MKNYFTNMQTQKLVNRFLNLTYQEWCDYLKIKYGLVKGTYFCNDNFKSTNQKIKRTKEGLFIHHIDEDKCPLLSSEKRIRSAIELGSEKKAVLGKYQAADRLVYCNYVEHFILHVKIVEADSKKGAIKNGFMGCFTMIPVLNDIYSGIKKEGIKRKRGEVGLVKPIINLKKIYFEVLSCFISLLENEFGDLFIIDTVFSSGPNLKYGTRFKNILLFEEFINCLKLSDQQIKYAKFMLGVIKIENLMQNKPEVIHEEEHKIFKEYRGFKRGAFKNRENKINELCGRYLSLK